MAYTTINKSTDNFNTKLYTGTEPSNKAVTGVGFQPDLVWIKQRSGTESHNLTDSVRGVYKTIRSNTTDAEVNRGSNGIQSFDSDGFTAGGGDDINSNGGTFASWNWKAGGSGSSNTDGSITSTVSANTTSGFSIVKWSGNGTYPSTIGHGLGVAPKMIIVKQITASTYSWIVYHQGIGNTHYLGLNTTDAKDNSVNLWNNTSPTSSVFTVNGASVNVSGVDYIAYCFAPKTGYSKLNSYTGNANANGSFIYCGFKPAFVFVKRTDGTDNWFINDNKRNPFNEAENPLRPNLNNEEYGGTGYGIDMLSNGFKVRTADSGFNASGGNYIFMAIGQSLVASNNVPCTAR